MDRVPAAVVRREPVSWSSRRSRSARLRFGGSLVLLAVAAHAGQACRPGLSDSYPSAPALAAAVLAGIEAGDERALTSIALSEREFRDQVWPELPAALPHRNLPFSYVWGDLHQKSEASLGRTIKAHARRRYALVDVQFAGRTDYSSFRVHRQAAFVVRDSSGQQSTIRVCGSLLETQGRWKVFSYVVDE